MISEKCTNLQGGELEMKMMRFAAAKGESCDVFHVKRIKCLCRFLGYVSRETNKKQGKTLAFACLHCI